MSLVRRALRWLSRNKTLPRTVSADAEAFGLVPSPVDPRDDEYAIKTVAGVALPSKVELDAHAPGVKNQGWIGSCASHAICTAMETLVASRGKEPVPLSERWHYWWVRQKDYQNTFPQDSGQYIRNGMRLAQKQGVAPELLCKYDEHKFNEKPHFFADSFASFFRIQSYHRCWSAHSVKQALAQGFPVVLGVRWYVDDTSFGAGARSGELHWSGSSVGGHAVTVVGYDDDHRNPDGSSGAFKIKNSWGTRWGQLGYGWASYAGTSKNFIEAFAVEVSS